MAKTTTKPVNGHVLEVCSFGKVDDLYQAARNFLAGTGTREALEKAVADVKHAADESESLEHIRDKAVDLYTSDDIDIDHLNFTHHNGSDGYWVGAWLWVPEAGKEDEDGEEDAGE